MINLKNKKRFLTLMIMFFGIFNTFGAKDVYASSDMTTLQSIDKNTTLNYNSTVYEKANVKADISITEGLANSKIIYDQDNLNSSFYSIGNNIQMDFPLGTFEDDNVLKVSLDATFTPQTSNEVTYRGLRIDFPGWENKNVSRSIGIASDTVKGDYTFDLDDIYQLGQDANGNSIGNAETNIKIYLVEKYSGMSSAKLVLLWDSSSVNFKMSKRYVPSFTLLLQLVNGNKGFYNKNGLSEDLDSHYFYKTDFSEDFTDTFNVDDNLIFKVGDRTIEFNENTRTSLSSIFGGDITNPLVLTYRLFNNSQNKYISKDIVLLDNPVVQMSKNYSGTCLFEEYISFENLGNISQNIIMKDGSTIYGTATVNADVSVIEGLANSRTIYETNNIPKSSYGRQYNIKNNFPLEGLWTDDNKLSVDLNASFEILEGSIDNRELKLVFPGWGNAVISTYIGTGDTINDKYTFDLDTLYTLSSNQVDVPTSIELYLVEKNSNYEEVSTLLWDSSVENFKISKRVIPSLSGRFFFYNNKSYGWYNPNGIPIMYDNIFYFSKKNDLDNNIIVKFGERTAAPQYITYSSEIFSADDLNPFVITYRLFSNSENKYITKDIFVLDHPIVQLSDDYLGSCLFTEFKYATTPTFNFDDKGVNFIGDIEDDISSFLNFSFEADGSLPGDYIEIYANGTKLWKSTLNVVNDNINLNISEMLYNLEFLPGEITLSYKIFAGNNETESVQSLYVYESGDIGTYNFKKFSPILIENISTTANTSKNLYGDNLPNSLKETISFDINATLIEDNTIFKIFANDSEVYSLVGSELLGSHTIYLNDLISSAGDYYFTYILDVDGNTSVDKEELVPGIFPFVEFKEPSVNLSLDGAIDGIYYSGSVDSDKKAYLKGSFDKGDLEDVTLIVYANEQKVYEGNDTSIERTLSDRFTFDYLDGILTFEYEFVSDNYNSGRIVLFENVQFKKNSVPEVSFTITKPDDVTNHYYGENLSDEDITFLNISISDSIYLPNAVLNLYIKKGYSDSDTLVDTFNINDILEGKINLSYYVTSATTYTFKYDITDGLITSTKKVEILKNARFNEFKKATLKAEFYTPIVDSEGNEYFYTGHVKNNNRPKINLTFMKNNSRNARWELYANNQLITSGNSNETRQIDLSQSFKEIFFEGDVTFKYKLYLTSIDIVEQEIGTKHFIKNDIPQMTDIEVLSAKGNYYFFGDDITDSLKTDLSYIIIDNIQLTNDSNNFRLIAVNGDTSVSPLIFEANGLNALGFQEFNLSRIIKSVGIYKFTFFLDDGIGDLVKINSIYTNEYSFKTYEFPKVKDSSIYSLLPGNINYTGYVSDSNITKFDTEIYTENYNTVTNYKLFIEGSGLPRTELISVNVSNNNSNDLKTSIDLSKFKINDKYLNGQYSFFYEINFAENDNPVVGELTDLTNTNFIENTAPLVSNISLKGTDNGKYYTGDVKESLRTTLSYTVKDLDNYNKLKVSIYEDNNGNNVYDDSVDVIVSELSTDMGVSSLGDKLYDFTEKNLYHNNETKTLKYMIEDGIGDRIDDVSTLIGTYQFTTNQSPDISFVDIEHLFGDDAKIYFGHVAVDHQALLKFELNKYISNVTAYFGFGDNPKYQTIGLDKNNLSYTATLSTLNNLSGGNFAITVCLDDGIADTKYFYLNNDKGSISCNKCDSHKNAANQGYKFPVIKNIKPIVSSETLLTIPVINNGIIYTQDVRDDRRAKLSIKIDDDTFESQNLYSVAIENADGITDGNTYNFSFKENLPKTNILANYDLAFTNLDGDKYLYLILDDGIADIQYVNLSGDTVYLTNFEGKNLLKFVKNTAPNFTKIPNISYTTNNKVFYGDVNISERISDLIFSVSEDCNYTIINGNFFSVDNYYNDSLGDSVLDNGIGNIIISTNSDVTYNLTEKNYDRFVNKRFPITVALDDDIANVVWKDTLVYDFVKNARPVLSGQIDYGTNKDKTKNYKSIFVSLDDSAVISQNLNLVLVENDENIRVDNYTFELNQEDNPLNPISTKTISNRAIPSFDLDYYGRKGDFIVGKKDLEIVYSDGIWDSSIAGDNFLIEDVNFVGAGLPTAIASLTGNYITDVAPDKSFIFDMKMDERYAGNNCYKGVSFTVVPKSANAEIELTEVRLDYSMNDSISYKDENGWTLLLGEDRRTSLFNVKDFLNNESVTKNWLNNTGNDNRHVRFRLKVVDELDQTIYIPINESDNFYLAREFAPGSPSRFLMYLEDSTIPSSDYTLNVGDKYRFEWTKPSDTNIAQGDDIVKYIFTYTVNGVATSMDIEPGGEGLPNNLAGWIKYWECKEEGDTSFSISSIDKFGRISRLKTIEKSGLKNIPPNDVDRTTIQSTFNTNELNGIEYIKRFNSKNYETEYILSWVNAGDIDSLSSDDYVKQWIVEYSPDANNWYFLQTVNNNQKILEGEVVSINYTLPSIHTALDDANQIFFRVTPIDNRNVEGFPSDSSNAYNYTSDIKEPVWSNLSSMEFTSDEGYAVTLNAIIEDLSEISYIKVNNEDIPFEKTATGAKFDYTIYKNGTYRFAVMDIYSNLYVTSQTVTGIDAVPPTVELIPAESQYTNKAYYLTVKCIDEMTGVKKVYIEHTDINGRVNIYESGSEFMVGDKQVDYKYLVEAPGSYKVTVIDRADNETVKSIEIDNINMNIPLVDFSQPSELQNQQSTISLNATVNGTRITSNLGSWVVLPTSTIKSCGEPKTTSVDGTDATIDVFENGILRVRFRDIFGNESPVLEVSVDNILDGNIENNVEYLMLESDYKANYSGNPQKVLVDGVSYIKWNNNETTSCQLYGHVKSIADFNGLQYAWIDKDKSSVSSSTYYSSYGDINKPDEILFKFTSGKQALYIVDIFGHFTQVVLTINGYVAPPPCEISYEVLTQGSSAEGVDVFFTITSGIFVDNGFYNVTIDGVSKNLFDDFVWGTLIDGKFVEDNTYKGKSFKYTFTENGSLKVWGQSTLDESSFESIIVNITNIDKSVPLVEINEYDKVTPQADKITLIANTNATFISLDELREQISGLGYGLTEEELNSYKVSSDGKTAEITLRHNVSGIFFYAKNAAGTIGNSENVDIKNIYKSSLEMDLWVFFEDGTSITYEEYLTLEDKSSNGIITINAVSSNTVKDNEGNYILRRFDKDENPGCKIIDSPYADGGNMVTASYTFTEAGSYTFKLRDSYNGYLEKTVVVGDIFIEEDLPEIYISTENIKGDNVPYVVSVRIRADIYISEAYFLDEDGNKTELRTIEKTVTENGTYTFVAVDKFGRKFEKSIIIDSIFELSDKPKIQVVYNNSFTTKELMVIATVSNGKFINLPEGWTVVSQINNGVVKIQKIFEENQEDILTAVNFYEDESSIINRKVNIVNIDRDAPNDPSIESDITSEGLLVVNIIDNGDIGSSGTKQFNYEIYSDSSNYTQSGIILSGESITINSSDRNYRDAEYIIRIVSEDNAGNVSEASLQKFHCDNSLVKDFMSTYNSIVTNPDVTDMKDFYKELIDDSKDNLEEYQNIVQKQFVSDKCDLLYEVLETGETEEVITVSKIENWLKQLAKNPIDTSFVKDLQAAIDSLSKEDLKQQYQEQLNVLLNNGNIINLKKTAPNTFNYSKNGYIINPLNGIIYNNNVAGHFTSDGRFERGIDVNDYYYLEDGTKIQLDLTFKTFIDTKGNTFLCANGLVNGNKYYDAHGNLIDSPLENGFYDSLGNWYELAAKQIFTVMFVDYNGTVLDTQKVTEGEGAIAPENPIREGYVFVKWDKDFNNVTSHMTIMAVYEREGSDVPIITPTGTPDSPSGSPTGKPTGTPDNPSGSPTGKPTGTPDNPSGSPTDRPTGTPDNPSTTPVPGEIAVTNIKLNRTFITIDLNDSVFLTATIEPENATNKTLNWISSNTRVADIVDGVVIPYTEGITEITVVSHNNLSATCTVKVLSDGLITDDNNNIYIPPSEKYPTIEDITKPTDSPIGTPSSPSYEYADAPSYWTDYLGFTMIGITNETNYSTGNLRGFYDKGLSTLLQSGSGNIDIGNKKNANVNLGFKGENYALIMSSIDINSTYNVNGFGLDINSGKVIINGNGGLGNNSYLVIFTPYSKNTTVAKDGTNISCDYDYDLQGYKVCNPSAGTYTLKTLNNSTPSETPSSPAGPLDIASEYGFVTSTYSNPILYKELIKMSYNALNRDNGGDLFSNIDKNSEIYREASILQKYGIISGITQDINSPISGKDAYDILYMTLSQTNPYDINYDISSYRYMNSVSLQDINSMITNIVQYF